MKKILKLFILITILNIQLNAFAVQETPQGDLEQAKQIEMPISEEELNLIREKYQEVSQEEWNKYFKKNTKKIKKQWKLQKKNLTKEYNNSYIKVLVYVDKEGNILSYKFNGSCVPSGDTKFEEYTKETLKNIKNFEKLPSDYTADFIAFTIKFSPTMNISTLKTAYWERYGIAGIEVTKNKIKYQIK